jgi:hypothetical protein
MPRSHIPGLLSSTTQLAFGLAGFLIAIVLLDSNGLAQWAQRLEIGPLRAVAAPATSNIDAHLKPLGIDRLRPDLIADLGRLGWSDDPETLADSGHAQLSFWPFTNPMPPPFTPPILSPPPPPAPAAPPPPPRKNQPILSGPSLRTTIIALNIPKPPQQTSPAPAPAAQPVPIAASIPEVTPLPPLGPIPPGHTRQVALVGDSMMAVGLSAVLLRTTATDPKLHLVKAFRSGTGLARPDVFDWLTEYPAMIGKAHPDVVIVALGANDAQGYVDSNGQVLTFGTDAWIASYRNRVATFINLLEQTGRQIIWIGLPPMRSPLYDSHTEIINRITYSVVRTYPNATWWNPTPYIGTPDGNFRDLGYIESPTGHREIAHLRADDGIHLSDSGATLLTQILLPCLEPLPLPPPPAPPPG